MRRIFWGFCRNWFLIDPLDYLSSRSAFGFVFAEIFEIEKRLRDSASRGVDDSPTWRVGESATEFLQEKSPGRWVGESPTLRLGESVKRRLPDSPTRGVGDSPVHRVGESMSDKNSTIGKKYLQIFVCLLFQISLGSAVSGFTLSN
jgi:hypothetical protein